MDYKNKEPIKYTKLPRLPYFNQQLMSRDQEFRSSILGPAPLYYTLMTFLMLLSVVLVSVLIILVQII